MRQEMKICLPAYKLAYSLLFAVGLSLVRGIAYVEEIGGAADSSLAVLAVVFCADTYLTERRGKRQEVFALYGERKKTKVILRRLAIQILWLWVVGMVCYGCFYWQNPGRITLEESALRLFGKFLAASAATVVFWSVLSMTAANLLQNVWGGIGGGLVLWGILFSTTGERLLGRWNVFAYSMAALDQSGNWGWIWGKAGALLAAAVMVMAAPQILKRRG